MTQDPSILSSSVQHARATETALPTTLARSYSISGVPTDAWVQIFCDRIVLGVSQLRQKVGNWCLCQAVQSPTDPKSIDFTISTVLGDRNDAMVGVYARRITERIIESRLISGGNAMVMLVGLSLKESGGDPDMFRLLVDTLLLLVRDALVVAKSA